MEMSDVKRQDLADKFTNETLSAIYGERFINLTDVEDDPEIDDAWETLNELFYEAILRIA